MQNMTRRTFLKLSQGLLLLGSGTLGLFSRQARANKVNYVNEDTFKAFQFKQDASKMPKTIRKDPKQTCANCGLYVAKGTDGKVGYGTCQIVSGGMVKATGWCNVWNAKAAAK